MTPVEIQLREMRKRRNLTQVQLAVRTGIDQATISRIESGTSAIALDVLERLCAALKCSPGDLLVRTAGKRR
ncbi:MAG: helix-turn-helix domain-containing protein [Planctomycetota bacterium]|jgi:amino-acid N-acetyltransferase